MSLCEAEAKVRTKGLTIKIRMLLSDLFNRSSFVVEQKSITAYLKKMENYMYGQPKQ